MVVLSEKGDIILNLCLKKTSHIPWIVKVQGLRMGDPAFRIFQGTFLPAAGLPVNVAILKLSSSPPARIMPSDVPNFICLGFRFATTMPL